MLGTSLLSFLFFFFIILPQICKLSIVFACFQTQQLCSSQTPISYGLISKSGDKGGKKKRTNVLEVDKRKRNCIESKRANEVLQMFCNVTNLQFYNITNRVFRTSSLNFMQKNKCLKKYQGFYNMAEKNVLIFFSSFSLYIL